MRRRCANCRYSSERIVHEMARYAELVYSDSRCYTLRALKIGERRIFVEGRDFPSCLSCSTGGKLLPLSDFGSQGAPIHYKAWVCSDPDCGFNIKIRNGDVYLNEPIANGATYTPRFR